MKKHVLDFFRRGLVACGFGPMVLAFVYIVLNKHATVESLNVNEVVKGIFSMTALAFIAGGMNAIYQIERLPLMSAVLIHGGVLYGSYLTTFLVNDWLESGMIPILIFTAVFIVGYLVIWAVIYTVIRKRTQKINAILKAKKTGAGTD